MKRMPEAAPTPWRHGPFKKQPRGPVFGMMHEDPAIELQAFQSQSRVFCIASAGCTARVLAAAGHHVTAVDINPAQLAYAESRAAGGRVEFGAVERRMALGRKLAGVVGWRRRKLASFLALSDPAEQLDYWDRRLDTRMWRGVLDTVLTPSVLGLFYAHPFLESLPRDFGRRLRHRLRRGWANHANRDNPFAASLLLGTHPAEAGTSQSPIQFACADAAEFLEGCPPGSFDAFTLSNIEDGVSAGYRRRLRAAIAHAATPGAVVVMRSFAEPHEDMPANQAIRDRSLLWGVVEVARIGGGQPCFT